MHNGTECVPEPDEPELPLYAQADATLKRLREDLSSRATDVQDQRNLAMNTATDVHTEPDCAGVANGIHGAAQWRRQYEAFVVKGEPMRKTRYLLSLLLLLTLISTGCMFRNVRRNAGFAAYVKAAKAYVDESAPYALANRAMIAAKSTLSPEQLADYTKARADVRAANIDVHVDLTVWELDGVEPPGFKAHHAALRAAQERMILLAGEVAGGGAQ